MADIINTPLDHRPLMTLAEAAAYLQLHEMTLYRHAKAKKLPLFKVGGRWRCRLEDLEGLARVERRKR